MFCKYCGNLLANDARFCGECGAAVKPPAQRKVPQQNTFNVPQPKPFNVPQPKPVNVPQPKPVNVPQSKPVNVPRSSPANVPYSLYMDAKGLSLLNYKFDIKSADGAVRYRAATVSESMITYNARIYYPDNAEALIIRQQKKMTLAAMNFDILSPDGTLITEVLQKVHFAKSEYQLPKLGLMVTGDFLSINFVFKRDNQTVAAVRKKVLSWGDCYEVEIFDPKLEQILLAAIMVIQMVIAASRRRRR